MSYIYPQDLLNNGYDLEQFLNYVREETKNYNPEDHKHKTLLEHSLRNLEHFINAPSSIELHEELKEAVANSCPCTWVVLAEGWCGDSAQAIPLFYRIASHSSGKINLRILPRDKNPELMDRHLTNGARSIPKLIVLNEQRKELSTWGPRPAVLQNQVQAWKAEGEISKEKLIAKIMSWYENDRTLSSQQELKSFIKDYSLAGLKMDA